MINPIKKILLEQIQVSVATHGFILIRQKPEGVIVQDLHFYVF